MSIEYIQQLSREQGRKAKRLGKAPLVFKTDADVDERFGQIPNLGNYTPKGWRHLEGRDLFVDKSGFGAEYELALTVDGYRARLKALRLENPHYGFGIVQEGQFQVYIGVFERAKGALRKRVELASTTPLPPIVGTPTSEGVSIDRLPIGDQLVVIPGGVK